MDLLQINTGHISYCSGYAESRIGGRSENQDYFGYAETSRGFIITVCDGMGGGPSGRTASTIAVNEILTGFSEANDDEETTNVIIKAIRRANLAIIEAGNEKPSLKGMGSTATVLLISEHSAIAAHVGDSRIYQIRCKKKIFRTFDHSMVFDLVREKVITEEQARLSAQSNIITRALGIYPDVQVDIKELSYEKGDRFILCTDGIHGTMPEKELVKMFSSRKAALGAVTDDIATFVDDLGRTEGGGHDNLTIAILETKKNSKLRPKMSNQTKLTLIILTAVCIISLAANIFLANRTIATPRHSESFDSLKAELDKKDSADKDSIKKLNDSIISLRKRLSTEQKND